MSVLIDVRRFEEDVCALERQEKRQGAALFYGSSTFTAWPREHMESVFAPIHVRNHGFGGSTAEDALYYYHRLVRPYAPKALVWYEGDNDMPCGYSSDEAAAISTRVFQWARADFPAIPIVIVPAKHSHMRDAFKPQQERYNALLRQWTLSHADAYYIDLSSMLYTPKGELRDDIFLEDGLHFNLQGYNELAALLRPVLMTILQEQWI